MKKQKKIMTYEQTRKYVLKVSKDIEKKWKKYVKEEARRNK